MKILQKGVVSNTTTKDIQNAAADASVLDFGDIKITKNGTYTFALRLYGRTVDNGGPDPFVPFTRGQFYIYLTRNDGTSSTDETVDMLEINTPLFNATSQFTYTSVLRGQFKNGDLVKIKISNKGYYS